MKKTKFRAGSSLFLCKIIVCCLFYSSWFSVSNLYAQLSGTYTIGGIGADYPDIAAATSALHSQGTGGTVTFKVRPGTYREQIKLRSFHSQDIPYHPVIFEGESGDSTEVVISYEDDYVLNTEGILNVTFRYLTLERLSGDVI